MTDYQWVCKLGQESAPLTSKPDDSEKISDQHFEKWEVL